MTNEKKKKELKEKVSPFAAREGEVNEENKKLKHTPIAAVRNKVARGDIGELETEILMIINEYEYMTSFHLNTLLKEKELGFSENKKLNKKLNQMLDLDLLGRFHFSSLTGKSATRVYYLKSNGKTLLEAADVDVKWRSFGHIQPPATVKARLAANQMLIAFQTKVKAFENFEVKHKIVDKETGKSLNTSGLVTLSNQKGYTQFIIESVRRDKNSIDTQIERLKIYESFYKNFEQGDSELLVPPYLVFLCEDKLHMAKLYEMLRVQKVNINANIYFTFDTLQLLDSLEESWYVFEETDTKINMNPIKIELLG